MWTALERKPIRLLFVVAAIAVSTLLNGAVVDLRAQDNKWEGPTDTAIDNPLPLFDVDRGEEALKQAVAIDKRLRQICLVFDDALAKATPQKINPKDVGVANAAVWRMERLQRRLQGMGEPSFYDFKSRCFDYRNSIQRAAKACLELPTFPGGEAMNKQLQAVVAQQQKVLEQVIPLIADGKYDAADQPVTKLLDLYGQLEPWVVLGRPPEALYGVRDSIDAGREALFGSAYREKLLADAKLTFRDPDELPNAIRGAATQLATAKEAPFFEETLTGPEIVRKSIKKWRDYEDAYRRAFAMRKMAAMTSSGAAGNNDDLNASIQLADAARAKMVPLMAEALAMLVEKDSQDVAATEVPEFHQAYIEALGELDARAPLKDARAQIEQGFTEMLNKAPEYKAQVAAYREATTWMLGWRRRATLARVKERNIVSHSPLTLQVKYVFSDTLATRLFDPPPQGSTSMSAQHMRRTVELAMPVLIGASVTAGPFAPAISSGPEKAAGASDLYWYSYPRGRVAVEGPGVTPDLWQAELKALESDLLIDSGAKPLTIEAASALTSARQGIFTNIGAAIDSFSFEPVLTYLHRKGSQPGATAFLGAPFREYGEVDNRSILLRVRLTEPDWIAHEYFFADLDADPTPGAVAAPAAPSTAK